MSYASVTSHNIPFGEMPKPDQSLREGGHFEGEHPAEASVDHKINILPAGTDPDHPDIKPHVSPRPPTVDLNPAVPAEEPHVSEVAPKPLPNPSKGSVELPESGAEWEKKEKKAEKEIKAGVNKAEKKGKEYAKKAKAELHEAESKLEPYWEKTKDVVLRPATLGGLVGVVNVGLLGTLGYFAYTRRDQPWDRRIVGGAVAGTLALFGAEGFFADSYLHTPEGREEAERAKREGSKLYLEAKERVLRPKVAGGLAGAFNVAVIGTVGYFAYRDWNKPWDRRVVAGVVAGLAALSGVEGWLGVEYKEKELPKRK